MEANPKDYLKLAARKHILKIIQNEKLLFSDTIIKINHYNMSQERTIVVTDKAVYNIKKKSVTISKLTDELVIHCCDNEHDYYYISAKKMEILKLLNDTYQTCKGYPLKCCCLLNAKSLKSYVTTKKEKKSNPSNTRMLSKDLREIDELIKEDENIHSILKDKPRLPEHRERTQTVYTSHKTVKEVKYEDFKIIKVVGRGSFGKVCLVEYLPTKEVYAMKSLKKDVLIEQEQIENTLLEKEILQTIDHPLLCQLIFCFQTEERIYFVMPFLNGGELFQHLRNFKTFDEEKVRFYSAQIGLALHYLHEKGIIYRDLKPENILMDDQGYLRLADFGMAKKLKGNEKATSFCGTPEYLAPEIITGEGHNKAADWWSFGILIYEMLCGLPPFYVENLEKMYELIKTAQVKFPKKVNISEDAKDLIKKLLMKKPSQRMGYKTGLTEIRQHPFFATVDFDGLLLKKIPAPFIPTINHSTDVSNFDSEFTSEEIGVSYIPQKNIEVIKANQTKFNDFSK